MAYLLFAAIVTLAGLAFYGDWVRLDSAFLQAAAVVSGFLFLSGFYIRASLWTGPGPEDGGGTGGDAGPAGPAGPARSGARLILTGAARFFSPECFFAARLYRSHKLRGVILVVTIWSFLALLAGTLMTSLEYTLRLDLTSSRAFSLAMDISGAALLIAIVFYIMRRLADKQARSITVMEDHVILAGFLLILLTGFLLEGARLAYPPGLAGAAGPGGADAAWSPVGLLFGRLVARLCGRGEAQALRAALFDLHALIVFAGIAFVPFSKQFHMFAAQIVTARAKQQAEARKRLMHE